MARFDHRPIVPAEEAAHAQAFPGEGFEVDTGGGKRGRVLAIDTDGEIAAPVLGEIQIDPAAAFADRGDGAFDRSVMVLTPSLSTIRSRIFREAHSVGSAYFIGVQATFTLNLCNGRVMQPILAATRQ
jgi:hypothetical protein